MAATGSISDEMLEDSNFSTLALKKTKVEDFTKMIDENVYGYSQKKKVVDALKDLNTKVDAAENKLSVIKAVGKAKTLEPEEKYLTDNFSNSDVKEKVKVLNAQIDAMLDEGRVTSEEKPRVLENLNSRKAAAKAADKAKLLEKLERQMDAIVKAKKQVALPVANLKEIDALRRKLKDIEAVEKKPAKSVTSADRQKMDSKPQVESDIRALERRSRMWFESEFEFAPRLSKALEELAVNEAEIRRKEEEEAWQRKLREEEEEIERKRKEAQDKQEEQEKKVTQQLEARRLEAAAKPQKAAAQPKKKEKKAVVKLDPKDLFVLPPQGAAAHEAEEAEMVLADVHVEGDEDMTDPPVPEEPPKPAAPEPAPAPKPKPTPAPAAVEKPKPKPKPAKVVIESKWDAPTPVPAPAAEGEEDASENPSLLASSGPSLADAAKPAKKVPAPQPKKKEKKKFTKLSNNDLGFDCDNPNYKGAN